MAGRARAGEEGRWSRAAGVGHHCPHHPSIAPAAVSGGCRSDLWARAVPSVLIAAALPHQPLPCRSLRGSASLLQVCPLSQQGPIVPRKKDHSGKIKDLKIPRVCLPERCFSERPARETPTALHPSLPGNSTEKSLAGAERSSALRPELTARGPCSLPRVPAWLHDPGCQWGPFYYSSSKMNPSLEVASSQVAGETWLSLSCKVQSSSMGLGLGDLSARPILISFTAPCGCCYRLRNNKRLWKQLDFTAYLLGPRELPNSSMRSAGVSILGRARTTCTTQPMQKHLGPGARWLARGYSSREQGTGLAGDAADTSAP